MSNTPESFSERLRKRVEELGITHAALGKGLKADGSDLGRAAVHGWLSGNTQPSALQLAVICERLEVSADYLLFGYKQSRSPKVELAKTAIRQLSPAELAELHAMLNSQTPATDELVQEKMPITRTPPAPSPSHVSTKKADRVSTQTPATSHFDTDETRNNIGFREWVTKEQENASGNSDANENAKPRRERAKGG
jgi:transcriptional regulator with XRE-family HTH domain